MERIKEEREQLMRGYWAEMDGRSKWEVSKVPRQKRVKLLTPSDKQTTL